MQKVSSRIKKLGSWVDISANYGSQKAATDGFIIGYVTATDPSNVYIFGDTDANNPPTTRCWKNYLSLFNNVIDASTTLPIFMAVKKNDYWKVTISGCTMTGLWWIPFK